MPDTDDRLHEALRGDPPAGVAALGDAERATLVELIGDARQRQARSLDESFDATLKHVPFPVRKIVKKVLLG